MNKNNNSILDFPKLESAMLVSTFFSIWLAVILDESLEHVMAYILIMSFGILHGSNDLTLIRKEKKHPNSPRNYLKVLLYYLLFVLGSVLIFYVFPSLALFVFILFSGYHFGEQHLVSKTISRSPVNSLLYFSYGSFILFLLFYTNSKVSLQIIKTIIGHSIPELMFQVGLIMSGISTLGFSLYLLLKKKLKVNPVKELFFLGVFFVVFKTASLLWGFAIYFILWHSVPSLYDQIFYLYGTMNKKSFKGFVKDSFPYWLISVVGLLVLLYVFRDNLESSLAFFFSFLAAITFPHVLVIKRLNQHQN